VAYESGLVADPRALENRVGLATLALRRDDVRGALAEYDAIIAARPEFSAAYLGRAWTLIRLGRLDDAAAALDDARRLGGDSKTIERQSRLLSALRKPRTPLSEPTQPTQPNYTVGTPPKDP